MRISDWSSDVCSSDLDALLDECSLRSLDLDKANFDGARLKNCDLSEASLRDASFVRSDARGTLFMETDLTGADLRESDLIDALMQKSDFRFTDLRGANLFRTDISQRSEERRVGIECVGTCKSRWSTET